MTYVPMYYAQAVLTISLEIQNTQIRPKCPICGRLPNIHEYKKTVKSGTLNGVPVLVELRHTRYMCKNCDITFMDEFDNIPDYRRMNVNSENYTVSKLGSLTFTEIASEVGISIQTVANEAKNLAQRKENCN